MIEFIKQSFFVGTLWFYVTVVCIFFQEEGDSLLNKIVASILFTLLVTCIGMFGNWFLILMKGIS